MREEIHRASARDSNTGDTRVEAAVAWLEEATLPTREEGRVQVFPSSLRIRSADEAAVILDRANT